MQVECYIANCHQTNNYLEKIKCFEIAYTHCLKEVREHNKQLDQSRRKHINICDIIIDELIKQRK